MIIQEIIPLTGLENSIHIILFLFGIGTAGSIIAAILIPRILTPIFLKIKSIIWRRYEDGYIENTIKAPSLKTFLIRGFYTILLTLGIFAFIFPNIGDSAALFMNADKYNEFMELGLDPRYNMTFLFTILGILMPLVIGVWSIGWSLEDAGLMHYRVEDDRKGKEAYEIEPVHVKYNGFVRGYAGVSSILFIIQAAYSYYSILSINPERVSDFYGVLAIPFAVLGLMIPCYIVYTKIGININQLRKGLNVLKQVKKEDIIQS